MADDGLKFGLREYVRARRRSSPARTKCRTGVKAARHSGLGGGGRQRERETGVTAKERHHRRHRADEAATAAPSRLDTSCFSLRTERMAKVLFERVRCSKFADLSLTCSRFAADYRHPENSFSLAYNDSSENENIFDYDHKYKFDSYPAKYKLSSTIIENKIKLSNYDAVIINRFLMDLGFMCINDKMYTIQPTQISFYRQNITCYNNFSPLKIDCSTDLGFEHLSMEDKFTESIPLELTLDKYYIQNMDENKNYYQIQPITPQNNRSTSSENKDSPLNNRKKSPYKYWLKRHMLFSKFDLGILLDEESLYSVCPEILSHHIAKRCKNNVALDPFCGAGGNIIQLAFTCKLVLAIDIDPNKIRLAKHNAEIYGIADKIEFIVGDFFTISSMLKADVIYMSPPWGGPEYLDDNSFSIESICKKKYYGGFGIFDIVKKIAPSIAFHMPKTTNLYECLWLANDFGKVETQQNIINGKFNSITAFYGEFTNVTYNDY